MAKDARTREAGNGTRGMRLDRWVAPGPPRGGGIHALAGIYWHGKVEGGIQGHFDLLEQGNGAIHALPERGDELLRRMTESDRAASRFGKRGAAVAQKCKAIGLGPD